MALCPSNFCEKKLKSLLKMSMVPLPCQECSLGSKNCLISESIEWLMDLKGNYPIWSRLINFNTSGFNRKLPMAMTKSYDVEIKGRLWSLWGHLRCKRLPICNNLTTDKPYLASTVMALCASRVFRLNVWTPQLLDSIVMSGERYLKESLKNFELRNVGFQLEDLGCYCSLEGINFKVCVRTSHQGRLYSDPFKGKCNLAFALINFLNCHQFGIIECFNRYLGFGSIKGTGGGYFMFDAQSMNYPLFPVDQWAPYVLRTNHLQILLYCIVVSLNVPYINADFSIHKVEIDVTPPLEPSKSPCSKCPFSERVLPAECWNTPSPSAADDFDTSECSCKKDVEVIYDPNGKFSARYHRAVATLPKWEVEDCAVLPIVELREADLEEKKSFVKMICSETVVPLTREEIEAKKTPSFVRFLPECLFIYSKDP